MIKSLIISILTDLPQSKLNMITREQKYYKSLIINTLDNISKFNKCRKEFFAEILILFLSIKGRINFLQLGRYGKFGEQRYRQQFEKPFPFLEFNKELLSAHGGKRFIIAFDPSYINKSGKETPGLGWYWSGCAGKAKWGLEIGGLAAIDLDNHTAFHLEAVQTLIDGNKPDNLTDWYVNVIEQRKDVLKTVSNYLASRCLVLQKTFC